MSNYIIRRLLTAILIIFCLTVINFIMINLPPGDPVDMMVDPNQSPESIQARKEALGLNDPLLVRYGKWLQAALQGDFGYSFSTFRPVSEMLGNALGPTLLLTGLALIVGLIAAVPLGILSAAKPLSKIDHAITTGALIAVSVPGFVFALIFIFFFSVKLKLLPSSGMFSIGESSGLTDWLQHLILPVATLSLTVAATQIRYVRASVLETLHQDFLRTARAKGLSEFRVICVHALRNALNPIVSITGLQVATLLGGSVVVEQIFSWPGIGLLTYQSVVLRDYPTLMAINLITAVIVMVANLVTDLIYSVIDPRIRYE